MKKMLFLVVAVLLSLFAQFAQACVGKTIFLGITAPANEKLMAEMASLLISERTGSSVKIQTFKDSRELYEAVKQGKVNIIVENTNHALEVLGRQKSAQPASAFELVKSEYRKSMNMIWMEPVGGAMPYAPVLTSETLAHYPALPKLLNKLSGVLTNDTYPRLLKTAGSDDKAKKVARDFLKSKKLI